LLTLDDGLTLAEWLTLALGDTDADWLTLAEGEIDALGLVEAEGDCEPDGLTEGETDDDPAPPPTGLWSTITHSAATRASPPGPTETRTPAVAASSVVFVQAVAVPGCW
jgi:hypothetical protein